MAGQASDLPTPPPERLGVPSRNPLPLSASQESQVRDIYYARVRKQCAEEIKGVYSSGLLANPNHDSNTIPSAAFAACALGRTFTVSFACRTEHRAMNGCMKLHATQAERTEELIIGNNYFVGGAVNPRDSDLKISNAGDGIVFNGFKFFNTGGVISDLTVLEGVYEDTTDHIFAIVKTDQAGINFGHDWNNVGLRLTESGSVKIENVKAPWADALGWDASAKKPDPAVLGIPFGTLLLPTIQLVFSNFYIGIAWGALNTATAYTNASTRAWPFGGDNKEEPQEEFYILATYGNFLAHLRAATALAEKAGQQIDAVYKDTQSVKDRAKVTAEARGEVAEWVASVKVVSTDVGLRVTSGVFEVTGAKATSTKVGLDRFWRDIRTHTLHDPVAYKNRELGRYQLLREVPEPTWYT
ncbi:hypothetical protein NLG97_g4696 [Lecanicillium saksenae]|uniref:Uncharacterized protein n=1 Tax=Lecanicillium saksenae TaxID=468837 RepID=A0ACC1QV58_9HYPO|nr:hypothetical protein NLG97_g4696 [Lecanicillium saksenae]